MQSQYINYKLQRTTDKDILTLGVAIFKSGPSAIDDFYFVTASTGKNNVLQDNLYLLCNCSKTQCLIPINEVVLSLTNNY